MPSLRAPTPLDLLQDALQATRDAREMRSRDLAGVVAFQLRICQVLLRQALEEDPQAVATQDGSSILVLCAQAHPDLALLWRELRGADAWQPTATHPFPLESTLNIGTRDEVEHLDMSDPRQLQAFMLDGMAHAMPLTNQQAKQGGAMDKSARERLEAQRIVVNALMRPRGYEPMQQTLVKALVAHDGALPHHSRLAMDFGEEMVLAGALPPATPLVGKPGSKRWPAWWEAWLEKEDMDFGEEMVPIFQQHGIDTAPLVKATLRHNCQKILSAIDRGVSLPGIEEKISAAGALANDPLPEHDGKVLWHLAVERKPALLPILLRRADARQILEAVSSEGAGIWECLVAAMGNGRKVSKAALTETKAMVPPGNGAGGMLWQVGGTLYATEAKRQALDFARRYPGLLLGGERAQAQGATQLLQSWVDDSHPLPGSGLILRMQQLFALDSGMDALQPELVFALRVLQEELLADASPQGQQLREQLPQLEHWTGPDGAKLSRKWLKQTITKVRAAGQDAGTEDRAERIIARLEHQHLTHDTPASVPSSGRRARL